MIQDADFIGSFLGKQAREKKYGCDVVFFLVTWRCENRVEMYWLIALPRHPVIFSDDDCDVQSPPKRIVFRFHYHSQKVLGSLQNSNFTPTANISFPKALLRMSFLFPRWDMPVPWRVDVDVSRSVGAFWGKSFVDGESGLFILFALEDDFQLFCWYIIPSQKLTVCPWNMVVGSDDFPFGIAFFQGLR